MFFRVFKQNRILKNKIWLLELEVRTLQETLKSTNKYASILGQRIDDLQDQVDNLKTPKNTRSCWPLSWHKKS